MNIKKSIVLVLIFLIIAPFVFSFFNIAIANSKIDSISSNAIYSWDLDEVVYKDLDMLIDYLKTDRIYQQLNINNLENNIKLKTLAEYCKNNNIKLYLLDGDVEWHKNTDASNTKKYKDEILKYNEKNNTRIEGFVLDAEFHGSDEYKAAKTDKEKQAIMKEYVDNMVKGYQFFKNTDIEFVMCIPVWFDKMSETDLERLFINCDYIELMNYHKKGSISNIEKEIELAKKHNKKINSISENMPPNEKHDVTDAITFYNDGIEACIDNNIKIKNAYNYNNLGFSYHYYGALVKLVSDVYVPKNENGNVIYNGKTIPVTSVLSDGITYVSVKDILEKIELKPSYNTDKNMYISNFNDMDILIDLNKQKVIIDSVTIEDVNIKKINNIDMIDVSIFSKVRGIDVSISEKSVTIIKKDVDTKTMLDKKFDQLYLNSGMQVLPDDYLNKVSIYDNRISKEIVDVSENNIDKAILLKTLEKAPYNERYHVQGLINLNKDIEKNKSVLVSFYAKSLDSDEKNGDTYLNTSIEQSYAPYISMGFKNFKLTRDWKKYYVVFNDENNSYLKNKAYLKLEVGFDTQEVLISNIEVKKLDSNVDKNDYRVDEYKGMEEDSLWRNEALKRIEKTRKSDLNVIVKDKNGNLINNANIDIKMIENSFMFGTAVNSYPLKNDLVYKEKLKENFNTLVGEYEFKWPELHKSTILADRIYNFANENGFKLRGHTLFWDKIKTLPEIEGVDWNTVSREKVKDLLYSFTKTFIEKYPDFIELDVVNEPMQNKLLRTRFGDKFVADYYNEVARLTNTKLFLNETSIVGVKDRQEDVFLDILKSLKTNGAKIDGVGVQAHMGKAVYPQEYYNQLDKIIDDAGNLTITEYDLNIENETVAANFLKDMMILSYSNPDINGFLMWGFTDKHHWNGNAPLYRSDWSEKPALQEYKKLLNLWKTNENGNTDNLGTYSTRAYVGKYNIEVEYENKTLNKTIDIVKNTSSTVEFILDVESNIEEEIQIKNVENNKLYFTNVFPEIIGEYSDMKLYLDEKLIEFKSKDELSIDGKYKLILLDKKNKEIIINYEIKKTITANVSFDPNSNTKNKVEVLITFDRDVKILNNNGQNKYVFNKNGSFEFLFEDLYGNKGSKIVIVDWIEEINNNINENNIINNTIENTNNTNVVNNTNTNNINNINNQVNNIINNQNSNNEIKDNNINNQNSNNEIENNSINLNNNVKNDNQIVFDGVFPNAGDGINNLKILLSIIIVVCIIVICVYAKKKK